MAVIRANSVLPARRKQVTLHTADGLELVGELALPADRDPAATIVCLHPLPTHGGMMDSHIFRKAAFRLPALAGIAVLRFNTRGTASEQGRSQGEFDDAQGERYDVAAAIEYAEFHDLPDIWVVGWSFGTDLTLMHANDPAVTGAVLLSPPLRFSDVEHLEAWADSGKPLTALVPEHDDYLQPPEAEERFAVVPQAEVVGVEGAKHLWVGDAESRCGKELRFKDTLHACKDGLIPGFKIQRKLRRLAGEDFFARNQIQKSAEQNEWNQ